METSLFGWNGNVRAHPDHNTPRVCRPRAAGPAKSFTCVSVRLSPGFSHSRNVVPAVGGAQRVLSLSGSVGSGSLLPLQERTLN